MEGLTDEEEDLNDSECGICGELHLYLDCPAMRITKTINDAVLPTRARLSVPDIVRIEAMADGSYCVIANETIEKGTQFGPLEAQRLLTMDPRTIFPLKLFNKGEDLSEYYLDTNDENNCNWMIFIWPAQNLEEQNLICFQAKSRVYYVAIKDIQKGEHLRVWYSSYYATKMKKQMLTPLIEYHHIENNNAPTPLDLNNLLKRQQHLTERDNWICKFCGKLENDISIFATHIREHYYKSRLRKIFCEICNQYFFSIKKLKKHSSLEHGKKYFKKDKVADEITTMIQDTLVGGPLLNDLLNDDNTIPEFNYSFTIPSNTENMLLESDAFDNVLTDNVKELDHFNFDIAETQEQYVCDICRKTFSKLKYILQHLNKHIGMFTCKQCLRIFTRKENLEAHNCDGQIPKFRCSICGRGFSLFKYLRRHTNTVHENKKFCRTCRKTRDIDHDCQPANSKIIACHICDKHFEQERYLKTHMEIHSNREKKVELKKFICEVCAKRFTTTKGLNKHMRSHATAHLECKICKRKFNRVDILNIHMKSHSEPDLPCSICNLKFKSMTALKFHVHQHAGLKPFKCDTCPKSFRQVTLLRKHKKQTHLNTCGLCDKSFESRFLLSQHKLEHDFGTFYECPLCGKVFKLRPSLTRHLKKLHPGQNLNIVQTITPKSFNIVGKEIMQQLNDNTVMTKKTANENNLTNQGKYLELRKLYNDKISNPNCSFSENTIANADALNDKLIHEIISANSNGIHSSNHNLLNEHPSANKIIIDEISQKSIDNINFENIINSCSELENHENGASSEKFDFNDFDIDLEANFSLRQSEATNREVCLSMPDLTDADQEIKLGENAYMLDDGTIVEPKDHGNVLVYILGK